MILYNMILQILSDGAVSANWVMVGIGTVTIGLLVRILNRIEKKQEQTDIKLNEYGQILVRHEERHDGHDDKLRTMERASDEFKNINKNLELLVSKMRGAS